MRIGTVIVALIFGIGATYGTVWMLKSRFPTPAERAQTEVQTKAADPEPPPISPTGPHPKAIVDKPQFDFGVLEVDQKATHKFVVRNEGEAPLKLVKGHTTCKCTLSSLDEGEIAPGKSATVELSWKVPGTTEDFRQVATILTNDPENTKIELVVHGSAMARVMFPQSTHWRVADIVGDKPAHVEGTMFSGILDKFNVVGFEYATPLMKAEAEPLPVEALKDFKGKCGYVIKVSLEAGTPVGTFTYPLVIKTDIPKVTEDLKPDGTLDLLVNISGRRSGPLSIFGKYWNEEYVTFDFGSFEAAKGRKIELNMFVIDAPEAGLNFTSVECDPPELKVELRPDPNFKGKSRRYFLDLEYPPHSPLATRTHDSQNMGRIKVKTNHPGASEIEYRVQMIAY